MRRTPREHFEKAEKYPSQTYHCRALTGARIESMYLACHNRKTAVAPSRARELKVPQRHALRDHAHVAPSRARELKVLRCLQYNTKCSRALTGARIESFFDPAISGLIVVAPSRARELKGFYVDAARAAARVAPSRARELKEGQRRQLPVAARRALTGARIESARQQGAHDRSRSRPHGRAN